jgi:hypothetical protein
MDEKVFYSKGGVEVTTSRVTINGENMFINQISTSRVFSTVSVRYGRMSLALFIGVVGFIPALFIGDASHSFLVGAFIFIAICMAAYLYFRPYKYNIFHLHLRIASKSERNVLSSSDKDYITQVSEAVNAAMSSRA